MGDANPIAVNALEWRDDHIRIIDQTYLPKRKVYSDIRDMGRMWEAIKKMRIRGATAIGIAAGYGFYMGIKELPESSFNSFWVEVERVEDYLRQSRPTGVNLGRVIERIKRTMQAHKDQPVAAIKEKALEAAQTIHAEDRRRCKQIGEQGRTLITSESAILTHGNTGSLASSQWGTALSVIFHAHAAGAVTHIWVDETRPQLQGARLTAWELKQAEIPFSVVADAAAGTLMQQGKVDFVMVGADRIAANGDTANTIGTYPLAVVAAENEVPFYVAAPVSTIDSDTSDGSQIPIEERDGSELTQFNDATLTPKKTHVYNPAVDVTPHRYITGFITEDGIIEPPFEEAFASLNGK